jgi:hypothetical protein
MLKSSLIFPAAIVIFLVLFAASGFAQEKEYTPEIQVDPASKARIEFLEKFWDFGSTPKGYIVYHNFPFTNTGSDTLIITRVKPTCGCTAAPLSSDRVAPGDTAKISVSLNTSKLQGKARKYVNIDCNDPINPYLKLTFTTEVDNPLLPIVSQPVSADFGEFKSGEKQEVRLQIKNNNNSDIDLLIVDKPPDPIMTALLDKTALPVGDSAELVLEIQSEIEPGPFASTVTIEAEGLSGTRISIPIKGTVLE